MKTLRVGLCGVGNVGGAVLKLLKESSDLLEQQGGFSFELIQVGARKGRSAIPYDDIDVTTNLMDVANNPDVDIFVELIGGTDFAGELVRTAIKNGKQVVTANKALLAVEGDEIFKLAKQNSVQIGFEASVAGGTPVIKALREGLVANKVEWFAGILNGTSNYILTEMNVEKTEFSQALLKAQELGLAEADPAMDIDGTDAAQKASILAALAFHVPFNFQAVNYEGIDKVDVEDLSYAEELGYSIKHIAFGRLVDKTVFVSAYPTLVPHEVILSQVGQQMNALEVYAKGIGSTVYYGPGAGPEPTASAVVADLVDLAKGGWQVEPTVKTENVLVSESTMKAPRYFRLMVRNAPGVIAKISAVFADQNISIEALIQHETKDKETGQTEEVPVIILSGSVSNQVVDKLLEELNLMEEVANCLKQFRIYTKIK
ncbi:homoserine dehydrogenase [Gammaproteobacteria bacterium]|nr:homoserine dehydrogenase [Gammaproteobacteria bacterium]|tara:strand:+ start:1084 stop:2373 length:1290 start_codon:yes stop_codon:yes gene_type:complete